MSENKAEFIEEFKLNIKAGQPLIWIETVESERLEEIIRTLFFEDKELGIRQELQLWENGTRRMLKRGNKEDEPEKLPITGFIGSILEKKTRNILFVVKDAHRFMDYYRTSDERGVVLGFKAVYSTLAEMGSNIVFISPHIENIPLELNEYVDITDFPLPDKEDIGRIVDQLESDISDGGRGMGSSGKMNPTLKDSLTDASIGLTERNVVKALRKGILHNKGAINHNIIPFIKSEKKQIIRKSQILELISTGENLEHIGGLNNLKNWIRERKICFSREAGEYGIPQPKGVALVGIPGSGKSLSCKAIANMMEFPLLRLDFGRIYGRYVGESESNLRQAIKITEAMSPCVLWIDELEKGLAGGHTGDGGVSMSEISQRIFGSFITWMQERVKPVFIVATANKPWLLPPELLRKGRFDELFFVGFPTDSERDEIFQVHFKAFRTDKNNIRYTAIPEPIKQDMIQRTKGYTGAEIENILGESLIEKFARHKKGRTDGKSGFGRLFIRKNGEADDKAEFGEIVLRNIAKVVPLIKTAREDLEHLFRWSEGRVKYANDYGIDPSFQYDEYHQYKNEHLVTGH